MSRCANCSHEKDPADATPWNETISSVDGNVEWLCAPCDQALREKAGALRAEYVAKGLIAPIRRPLAIDEPLPDYWVQKPTFRIAA
jgi:hypothetical protein